MAAARLLTQFEDVARRVAGTVSWPHLPKEKHKKVTLFLQHARPNGKDESPLAELSRGLVPEMFSAFAGLAIRGIGNVCCEYGRSGGV